MAYTREYIERTLINCPQIEGVRDSDYHAVIRELSLFDATSKYVRIVLEHINNNPSKFITVSISEQNQQVWPYRLEIVERIEKTFPDFKISHKPYVERKEGGPTWNGLDFTVDWN
jgi:hypothetical protein